MPTAAQKEGRGLRVFCPAHRVSFECAGGGRVVCEAGSHVLAERFPPAEFWEYCCDCESCWPSAVAQQGRGPAEKCPVCGRAAARRFLCGACRLFSLESDEGAERKVYRVVSGGGVRPACPGCGAVTAGAVRRHDCQATRSVFMTTRAECPFCAELISELPPFPSSVEAYLAKADALPITKFMARAADGGKGVLVPSESGEFVLIQAARDLREMIALPRRHSFGRAEDFSDGPYTDFFACEEPAPGEVLVVDPARFVRVKDGWMLTSVGRLGVRRAEAARREPVAAEKEGVKTGAAPARATQDMPAGRPRGLLPSVRTAGLIFLLTVLLLGSVVAYRALAPPLSDDADPPAPSGVSVTASASDRRALREKLSELNGVLQQLPEARAMAQRDRGGPATMRYEELLSRTPDLSRQALDALKESEAKEAALRNEAASLLAAERSARAATEAPPAVVPEWLIPLLAVFCLGLFLFWLQFFWLRSMFRSLFRSQEERRGTAEHDVYRALKEVTSLRESLKSLGKQFGKFEQAMSLLTGQVSEVQHELGKLKRGIAHPEPRLTEVLAHRVAEARESLVAAPAAGPLDSSPRTSAEPVGKAAETFYFPALVSDFMSLDSSRLPRLKPDVLGGMLIETKVGEGDFLLLDASTTTGNDGPRIVPAVQYFRMKQDFHHYYEAYFDCPQVSAGMVRVITPASVTSVAGGWKLLRKGLLEVI